MINIRDEEFLDFTSELIYNKLWTGVRENEFLFSYGLRSTGKSTALVKLANVLGCAIIVENRANAIIYKQLFDFRNVYSQDEVRGRELVAVCDEGVNYRQFKDTKVKILTGFTNSIL